MNGGLVGVIALGTFDLPHVGHVRFLRAASSLGDRLTVAVNPDAFTARFKRPPILSLAERMEMVAAYACVDRVIVNAGCEDSRPAILDSGARIIAHGDDWTGPGYLRQLGVTQAWLDEHHIEIRYVPYTAGVSTSGLIERIVERADSCPRCHQPTTWKIWKLGSDAALCSRCGMVSTAVEIAQHRYEGANT